jgi:hypothetical protein
MNGFYSAKESEERGFLNRVRRPDSALASLGHRDAGPLKTFASPMWREPSAGYALRNPPYVHEAGFGAKVFYSTHQIAR